MTLPPGAQNCTQADRHVYRPPYATRTLTHASTLGGQDRIDEPPRVDALTGSREGHSDVDGRDLDELIGKANLHTVEARNQSVERELAQIVDFGFEPA